MEKLKTVLSISLIIVICLASSLLAKEPDNFVRKDASTLAKAADVTQVTRTMSNISNWGYWMYHNGKTGIEPNGSTSGGIYPRGTAGAIYTDGLVWGGKDAEGNIHVGGATYNIGTQPAWIDPDGTCHDKTDVRVKIWRIRSDWETLTYDKVRRDAMELNELSSQADVSDAMCQAVIDQYAEDWDNWPSDLGAPTYADGTPGIANADQVIWLVCNDLDAAAVAGLYGSDPIGIELQITAWAYAQPDARLGQVLFKKFKFINKSGADVTDMYVSQWCDPDLGNAGDDLVGCDTTLSMGFVYNGGDVDNDYSAFGMAPAAFGYDFFQGPMVDGVAGQDLNKNGVDDADDYAVFDLKKVGPGKINLPMTTFGWFAAGSAISDPTLQDYEGTLQWYNMLQGYVPTDDIANPTPWTTTDGEETVYPLAGDPVAGTGDLDGIAIAASDRRMCLTSGPFEFADGDIQEVVVAVIGGIGGTRFSSISAMKATDEIAQSIYDVLFSEVPKPPPAPDVKVTPFENYVMLDWGSNTEAVATTEDFVTLGYKFEGYNIYQLPNAAAGKDQATLIATYDLVNGIKTIKDVKILTGYGEVEVPVQVGEDTGIKRSLLIEKDYITGNPFYEGNTYYFAVTAYNQDVSLRADKALESALIATPAVIQEPLPGDVVETEPGDVTALTHSAGTCDGGASYKIIDPYALTGDDYEVFFDQQHYYRDVDGIWKETAYPDAVGKYLGKVTDVSPSSITGSVLASATVGTYDLIFTLDLQAPGGAWVDGVRLDIPSDLTVNTWSMSGAYGSYGTAQGQNCVNMEGTIDASNSITWGDSARSTFGCIEGTIILTVNVQPFEFPKTVGYAVYDDAYDGTTIDAEGTITLTELGYEFKSISHWNLKDVTSDEILLEDQTIVSGKDVDTGEETGDDVIEYIDGFQVSIQASYSAPTDFTTYTHTGPNRTTPDVFSHSRANAWLNYDQWGKPFEITSYADHGWSGGAGTAASIDAYGFGTTSVDLLQRDYELRFTGEYDAAVGNYHPIKDGTGSLAILYGARGYDIADHPDANNPGDGSAFFIQVPFEVWDMEAPDGPQQISMLIYDRMGDATATDFYAFNPADRVYCEFLMVPYEDVIAGSAGDYLESGNLTWNTVWWNCDWTLGDKLLFQYDNPIQLGVDKFAFSTTAPVLSNADSAKVAVEKINVFPNPYYAYNSLSTNRFDNYVTFTHLPGKATIRIFTLAGIQVKVFEKDSPSIQFLRWDLQNESGLPVASGVYIAYVDMPNLNKTKVLKFVIIQNKQILEYY